MNANKALNISLRRDNIAVFFKKKKIINCNTRAINFKLFDINFHNHFFGVKSLERYESLLVNQ